MARPRICLNGIVKNESQTINRLLDSLDGKVDEFVIVDTGSTDDTITKMESHPIPGVVLQRPFDNFGKARTHALQMAHKHATAEWILLLDADMVLKGSLENLPYDDADVFSLKQSLGNLTYHNIRMLRRSILTNVTCVGATHEFYDLPNTARHVMADQAWIDDRGDGGCKTNKFTRDLALLEKQRPRNARCTFYLAQTHLALGNVDEALKFYMKRLKMGAAGFELEADYARQQALGCYLQKNDLASAQKLFSGSRHDSCAIASFLREKGDNINAWTFVSKGMAAPPRECLFDDTSVDERLAFERTVLWHYVNPDLPDVGLRLSMQFLDRYKSQSLRTTVIQNTRFYVRPIGGMIRDSGWRMEPPWHTSTPSSTDLTRAVNYSICPTTGRYNVEGPVSSRLFVNQQEVSVNDQGITQDSNASCLGIEDVRVGNHGMILASSLQYTHTPGVVSQVVGLFKGSEMWLDYIVPASTHEKNWVFAGDVVIHSWFPFIKIGVPTPDGFIETKRITGVPGSFEGVRGSSNGIQIDKEWLFVVHNSIDSSTKRYYTHRLVVLDGLLTRVVRSSLPFTFTGAHAVEFCMSLDSPEPGVIRMGFSEGDNTTKFVSIRNVSFYDASC